MLRTSFLYGSLIVLLAFCSTRKNEPGHALTLSGKYSSIKQIRSSAGCKGPKGNYTTDLVSYADGSFRFEQVYAYDAPAFHARVSAAGIGLVTDSLNNARDTLSAEAVEMIRCHDFHRMHTNPGHFFHDLVFETELDKGRLLFRAKDRLDLPVRITYSPVDSLLSRVEMRNPVDTSQSIDIRFIRWSDSPFGKLVKELEIIQDGKDHYYFNFTKVIINPA